ncbi:MAG: hypothetical protein ACRET2_14895 [Steroidobacteraceae bacterium]
MNCRVALRKGMIDLRLAELREGYGCATMRILDDRPLIALKRSADYRIARLGSVSAFPAAQRPA